MVLDRCLFKFFVLATITNKNKKKQIYIHIYGSESVVLTSKAINSFCFYWFCTHTTSLAYQNNILLKGNRSSLEFQKTIVFTKSMFLYSSFNISLINIINSILWLIWILSTIKNTHTKEWSSIRSTWILKTIRDSHKKEEFYLCSLPICPTTWCITISHKQNHAP